MLFVPGLWRGPWRIPRLGLCRGVRPGLRRSLRPGVCWCGRPICARVKHRVKHPVRVLHLLATKAILIRPLVVVHL